jgi:hypothetical protein
MEKFWEKQKEKIIIFIGIILIIIHGLFTDFLIDWITIIIYIIIASPMLFEYVEELKIFGAKFNFKKQLKSLKENFEENKEKIKPDEKTKERVKKSKKHYETFNFEIAKENIEKNPNLALASMRIEIEKILRIIYEKIFKKEAGYKTITQISKDLEKRGLIKKFQLSLLRKIIEVCNYSIHGVEIDSENAKEILNIANSLNKSFSIGYCINFERNKNYLKQKLICPYEHCIELMPLKYGKKSCSIFGHDCPGGEEQARECKKK